MNDSRVVLGTEVFSGDWGIEYSFSDIEKILNAASKHKIIEIDTASSYGQNHKVEELIGNAISDNRHLFSIASKFYINQSGKNRGLPIRTINDLKKDLHDTLKYLRTDYLDLYYYHSGTDEYFFQDEIWKYLNEMVKHGVIRNLGLSLNHGLVKSKSNKQLVKAKDYGISVVQTVFNFISNESLEFVIPYCKKNDIKVYGRMPLAKGLLSGKYNSSSIFSINDPRSKDLLQTKKLLTKINEEKNINVDWAVKWALNHVDKIVVGTKSEEQIIGVALAAI